MEVGGWAGYTRLGQVEMVGGCSEVGGTRERGNGWSGGEMGGMCVVWYGWCGGWVVGGTEWVTWWAVWNGWRGGRDGMGGVVGGVRRAGGSLFWAGWPSSDTDTHMWLRGPKQGQAWEGNRWKLYIKNNNSVIKLIVESCLLFKFYSGDNHARRTAPVPPAAGRPRRHALEVRRSHLGRPCYCVTADIHVTPRIGT